MTDPHDSPLELTRVLAAAAAAAKRRLLVESAAASAGGGTGAVASGSSGRNTNCRSSHSTTRLDLAPAIQRDYEKRQKENKRALVP